MGKPYLLRSIQSDISSFDLSSKQSTMRASVIRLAKGFGELPLTGGVGVRGVTKYSISPFEQKAFAGFIGKGVPNTLRRIKSEFFYVVPPFAIGYLIYDWGEREHERLQRKQPGQFDHET